MSPKLRKALRGGFGYAVQCEAWDAVFPRWREVVELVNGRGGGRFEHWDKIKPIWEPFREQATPTHLRAWYCLLRQDLYRRCPALGGWFPE